MTFFFWIIGFFVAVLAFLANPYGPFGQLWPPAPGTPYPTASLLPWFVLLNVIESVALAVVALLLLFAWPKKAVRNLTVEQTQYGFISLVWLLGSWWLHDSLHIHVGDDLLHLLYIEYAFHVTAMLAAGYLVFLAFRLSRK